MLKWLIYNEIQSIRNISNDIHEYKCGRVGPVVTRSTEDREDRVRILHWPNVNFSVQKK